MWRFVAPISIFSLLLPRSFPMSIPFEPNPPVVAPRTPAGTNGVVRVIAFLAGIAMLFFGAFMSFGGVLAGAAGMGIVALARRQRRQQLTRWGGWFASTISVAIVFAIFAFIMAEKMPAGTWQQVEHAADSAAAASAKQPPPAWVERVFPGTAARRAAGQRAFPSSAQSAFVFASIGLTGAMVVAFFGTFGWGAGMLLGFGARGRWPGSGAPAADAIPDSSSGYGTSFQSTS